MIAPRIPDFTGKRAFKITLRTLHVLSISALCGGLWFVPERPETWLPFAWLTLASGLALALLDGLSNPLWWVQVRGLAIYVKLILIAALTQWPAQAWWILAVIIILSVVISHAPGNLRYYSLKHRRVIRSAQDAKG
ncbi:hypothetical protein AAIA72_09680 [Hahella sp. SMD15-11]|uniref:Uncharacterized protein n=1 Tax=Thermohahella caldifontis TaxID=3142973 RepID=A0AB39USF5_9GAMM